METQTDNNGLVILDDELFYMRLNVNYGAAEAPGFLLCRCYVGVTTPGGYECIGSFERRLNGLWRASIDAPYDPATGSDCRELGEFVARVDAIAALWRARHDALRRHAD